MRRTPLALALIAAGALCAASPALAATPGRGFKMPSGLVTCGILTDASGANLFCAATYIKRGAYDGRGVVELPRTGRARIVPSGNDILFGIGGIDFSVDPPRQVPRPKLGYGKTWRASGFRCVSRESGLTCRRGDHGFFLSKERQRFF